MRSRATETKMKLKGTKITMTEYPVESGGEHMAQH